MIFSKFGKKNIQECIIEYLIEHQGNDLDKQKIIGEIQKKIDVSIQAIYKAMRSLRDAQVIFLYKDKIGLHKSWIDNVRNLLASTPLPFFKNMGEKNSISYIFQTPGDADKLWAHIFGTMIEDMSGEYTLCTYVPHDWFMLVRDDSERWLIKKAKDFDIEYLGVIGNATALDYHTKDLIHELGARVNVYEKPLFPKKAKEYYLNIFDDYILEVTIDADTSKKIHHYFQQWNKDDTGGHDKLEAIIQERGKTRLKITRDKEKAATLRKKLTKDFVLK